MMLRRFIHNQQHRHGGVVVVVGSSSSSSLLIRSFSSSTSRLLNNNSSQQQQQSSSLSVDRGTVWALWNEGNLFSLNTSELTSFLESNKVQVPEKAKKTALVRLVEDLMSKENPNAFGNTAAEVDTVASLMKESNKRASDQQPGAGGGDMWTDAATSPPPPALQQQAAADSGPRHISIHKVYDESDYYGDWSIVGQNAALAEDGSPLAETIAAREKAASDDDFIAFSNPAERMGSRSSQPAASQYLAPKGYQFLHEKAVGDFGLANVSVTGLPGCHHIADGSAVSIADLDSIAANKSRFRRAFHWAVSNAWANNREAEINIGAGRTLFWDGASKDSRAMLPVWVLQQHICDVHPYQWYAVAHEDSVAAMEKLASDLGMTPTNAGGSSSEGNTNNDSSDNNSSSSSNNNSNSPSSEISYKLNIRTAKLGGAIDAEVNENFETTHVYRPWQRYLVTHFVRENMPDIRFLVRARAFVSRKDSEPIFRSPILRESGKSVQPIMAPEIGDIVYCAHRVVRRWSTKLGRGPRIMLVETRRTPLITTTPGDEAERVEYELIANIPRPEDNVDISELADELWDQGMFFALRLEETMENLNSYIMKAASFL